jgi:hypothetical protein
LFYSQIACNEMTFSTFFLNHGARICCIFLFFLSRWTYNDVRCVAHTAMDTDNVRAFLCKKHRNRTTDSRVTAYQYINVVPNIIGITLS